ncbi:protoporphyrinogen/coproporphyrinogen oxidase [Saccharopolyspora griseoalba]|uniref:Protoporphyrinogen/coproporphyrinogen oxidase n=1 Tax=Saccharopolyspora griseoalba TaxID=1431848 RepID=A0ABW2LN63_9PSEU
MTNDVDVAVVGAGIAGLTAARELSRAGLEVRVYEASERVAGRMASVRAGGSTIDTGAEQLSPRGYQATWELLGELGFRADDVPPIGHPIAIRRNGQVHNGFGSLRGLLTGAGMSVRARRDALRLRVPVDAERPERSSLGLTTVAELARRHHPEVRDYLLQPAASFCLWDVERSCAAVLLGMQRAVGDAANWRTYRDGMDAPCRRMAEQLDVVLGHPVREVVADRDRARLRTDAGEVTARQVLLCVPAPIAAELHANPPREEAEFLAASTFTSALKAAFPLQEPVQLPGRPYLLVTPRAEEDVLAGLVLDHVKHPGRVPAGRGLVTALPNHERTRELLGAPDAEVISQLAGAVRRYLPGVETGGAVVHRHPNALPEATPAALAALPRFRARPTGPVDYAGDWTTPRPYSEGAVRAAALAASRALSRLGSPLPV